MMKLTVTTNTTKLDDKKDELQTKYSIKQLTSIAQSGRSMWEGTIRGFDMGYGFNVLHKYWSTWNFKVKKKNNDS